MPNLGPRRAAAPDPLYGGDLPRSHRSGGYLTDCVSRPERERGGCPGVCRATHRARCRWRSVCAAAGGAERQETVVLDFGLGGLAGAGPAGCPEDPLKVDPAAGVARAGNVVGGV